MKVKSMTHDHFVDYLLDLADSFRESNSHATADDYTECADRLENLMTDLWELNDTIDKMIRSYN